jgi:hypothetical protein
VASIRPGSARRALLSRRLSYIMSIDQTDAYRQSATYVDRILKVPKPAIFQFQQPTKFETAIDLRIASVNLIVPPATARSRRRGD